MKSIDKCEITRRDFLATATMGAGALAVGERLAVGEHPDQIQQQARTRNEKSLNIALLQMTSAMIDPTASTPWGMIVLDSDVVRRKQADNLRHADEFCRRAAAQGADIALFPEMWNIGYAMFDDKQAGAKERWLDLAVDQESEYVYRFTELARELNMAIAVTYLQKWKPAPRNAVSIISRTGEIVLTYAKVHTCDFTQTEASLTPGDDFPVCTLETKAGPVRIGCMICYDREFPESARILMLNGAEVILVPNACDIGQQRADQLKTRAFENALAVAMTNYASLPFDGNSLAYDAMGNSLVNPINSGVESLLIARLDLQALREYRQTTIWGNAFRRPRKYKALMSENVDAVFARKDFVNRPFDRLTR
jgi:predicted amidohydrolase